MAPSIRIAIVECDNPGFVSINKRGNYGGIFSTLLKAAAPGAGLAQEDLVFSVFNVVENTTNYPRLEDIDGVLFTGSSMFMVVCYPVAPIDVVRIQRL